jgi:MOSC domain-containing protein YiiM
VCDATGDAQSAKANKQKIIKTQALPLVGHCYFRRMKIVSVNIGKTQALQWKSKTTQTAFLKQPVQGPVQVIQHTLKGDEQADPRYHGGEHKAVYAYDEAHYEVWKRLVPRDDWQHGMFGENLTTQGLLDSEVQIGDVFEMGSAWLQVTQPRFPCMKLNMRFNMSNMLKLFTQQQRNGIYFKVVKEGVLQAGDAIQLVKPSSLNITISDVVQCYHTKGANKQLLQAILAIPELPKGLRKDLQAFLLEGNQQKMF